MIYRHTSPQQEKVIITFALPETIWADQVSLVADFNNWEVDATPLNLVDDQWQVTLELPKNARFEYRYMLNAEEWLNEWKADHTVPNPKGGMNSVICT